MLKNTLRDYFRNHITIIIGYRIDTEIYFTELRYCFLNHLTERLFDNPVTSKILYGIDTPISP